MKPWHVLALPPLPEAAVRGMLGGLGDRVEVSVPARRDRAALLEALPDAEIVIGDWSGTLVLDAEAVRHAPKLAFAQQPSVGVDGHDLEALAAVGVPLANTAGANALGVAEWCVAAAFALVRRLVQGDAATRAGGWPQLDLRPGELSSCRVGVLGHGAIGALCTQMFSGLGCQVCYWSRTPKPDAHAPYRELDELIETSDVLVVVLPLAEETRGLLDAARLARMPQGSYLVNAARGGIVDERALLDALASGHLAGAALDVYATEPLPPGDPLRESDRVLLSPHVAGATQQSTGRLLQAVLGNLEAAVTGRPVANVVNGVTPVIRRRD
ncbi:2-hydroxyacid dehydrogenase [Acrocarpospora phusangensis]|uniref:2-hydroxyacid dehydrogenase n=1 Tax=Acrocarpospora phusangensis TaxID=1070424 RepID=A0A919USE6_9ACTN|nr:2-hydroxyacid dehydrogenase [Acrocarpospora phusangensis]GIH28563.1 2-hydroxyacid dehydrogenase [Acrocarpospora phusangensis]